MQVAGFKSEFCRLRIFQVGILQVVREVSCRVVDLSQTRVVTFETCDLNCHLLQMT